MHSSYTKLSSSRYLNWTAEIIERSTAEFIFRSHYGICWELAADRSELMDPTSDFVSLRYCAYSISRCHQLSEVAVLFNFQNQLTLGLETLWSTFLFQIDWESIVISGKYFIKDPTSDNCKNISFNRCDSCEEPGKCWHNGACQRFEKSYTSTQYRRKSCHPLCLGDCSDRSASGCFTCKDLSEDSRCVEECSENK